MNAQFRPCIDLHGGVVKQIVGGTLESAGKELKTNFVSERSPAYYAGLYRRDGLRGGHVIMLGPGNETAAREALAAWPGGLQIGGGVNADNAKAWLDAGAEKVIVTSFVFSGGELNAENLRRLLGAVGKEHIVLDLSCRRKDGAYFVVTDRWRKFTALEVNRATLASLAESAAEFLVHAVDVEGRCGGIDRELLEILAADSPLECVYAGGITGFEDIQTIERIGKGRVHYTIGSALDLFGGKLPYAEVVSRAGRQRQES